MLPDAISCDDAYDDLTTMVVGLFDQYYTPVCGYLSLLVGDEELARDLTQETFLRLFRGRTTLAGVANRRAWLYRVATNVAFNALRRRRRFTWLPWRAGDSTHLVAPGPSEQVERRTQVEQALTAVPPHYRAALLLYSYHGFSVQEVAAALEISPGAVKTRLYRARELFRAAYEQGEQDERASGD